MASLGCPHTPTIDPAAVRVVIAKQNECHKIFTVQACSFREKRGMSTSYVVREFSRPGGCTPIHNPVT